MLRSSIVCVLVVLAMSSPLSAMSRSTDQVVKACHDHVWFDVAAFKELPHAVISVNPGLFEGEKTIVFWAVRWDEPFVRAAGECTVIDSRVEAFVDYSKPK